MDAETQAELAELVRGRGLAALGTSTDGGPLVSMVLYAASADLSSLFIHISRLARHTEGLLADPRIGLLITEPDRPGRNPLSMARVSIQGRAEPIAAGSAEFEKARDCYVAAHPNAAFNFTLGDFLLIRIRPIGGRFVAGFGRIVDFDDEGWARLALSSTD